MSTDRFALVEHDEILDTACRLVDTMRSLSDGPDFEQGFERFRGQVEELADAMVVAQNGVPECERAGISWAHDTELCGYLWHLPSRERFRCLDVLYGVGKASLNPSFLDDDPTLMVQAVARQDLEVIKYLAARGYPFGEPVEDDRGTSLLEAARQAGRVDMLPLLVKLGEPVAGPGNGAPKPLLCAVEHDDGECVVMLLQLGASPSACNAHGNTAMDIALKLCRPTAFRALLEHGEDPLFGPGARRPSPVAVVDRRIENGSGDTETMKAIYRDFLRSRTVDKAPRAATRARRPRNL